MSEEKALAGQSTFTLVSAVDLVKLPPPEWLVEGVVEKNAFAVLYGPTKSYKSFAAIDLAMCIATGKPWHGHATSKGDVVYVIGEGTNGAARRVHAWMVENAEDAAKGAFFLLKAPQPADPQSIEALVAALNCEDVRPSLIVLDTLARCFVGGDENSAKEVGQFIDGCRSLQSATGATVLVVHHTGHPSQDKGVRERGSSALRAAADTMIRQTVGRNGVVSIENEKQKDDEEFQPIRLRPKQVTFTGVTGTLQQSCVLVTASALDVVTDEPSSLLNKSQLEALRVLDQLGVAKSGTWKQALIDAQKSSVPDKTFDNWRKRLLECGLVEPADPAKHTYRVTAAGAALITVPEKHAA